MPYALDLIRLAASALVAADGRARQSQGALHEPAGGLPRGPRAPAPGRARSRYSTGCARSSPCPTRSARSSGRRSTPRRARWRPRAIARRWPARCPRPASPWTRSVGRRASAVSAGRAGSVVVDWRGAPVVREVKALVPSAWSRARGSDSAPLRCAEIANGRHRALDPWYRFVMPEASAPCHGLVVRRLSPNNRKIEAEDDDAAALLSGQMLEAMGAGACQRARRHSRRGGCNRARSAAPQGRLAAHDSAGDGGGNHARARGVEGARTRQNAKAPKARRKRLGPVTAPAGTARSGAAPPRCGVCGSAPSRGRPRSISASAACRARDQP